ncbi:ribonuclease Z [Peribacillus simplex]|uniref:MBL fold metallo-hydrolase n=1 Tax=Peribacillus simplex TaxID=1478 RepID=UPI0024E20C92|nr:MBL fold metallo-hydrolase [Peribacillus simplex]MDF9760919.1 ribonuclease Z [Peribacillus simplex]
MKKRIRNTSICFLLVVSIILSLSLLLHSFGQSAGMQSDFKVTLLGTGSPILSTSRSGPATLVEVGNEKLLFDAGRGTALQLYKANMLPGSIDKLFLSHLHSDHTIGIPDIWLTGSLPTGGRRELAFNIWGPKGTKKMMLHMNKAYKADLDAREDSGNGNVEGASIIALDIKEGVVYQQKGIEVIAFKVDHKSIEPAFAYRVNYKGHSVVISGDTRYNENLIQFAKGADVVIHEVAAARPDNESESISNILDLHTTPEEAGKVFSQIQPKLAVYSHIVLLGGLTEEKANLPGRTKETYEGTVVVGEDLLSIEIGDKVQVLHP